VFWERSTVWRVLRNPAYRGQAAFGKKQVTGERTKATRRVRVRGERHGLAPRRAARPAEEWISIPVPAIVSDETFELAQAPIQENKHFAARNTKHPAAHRPGRLPQLWVCVLSRLGPLKQAHLLLLPLHRLQLPPRRRPGVLKPSDPR
jgi:hypothetical protein